MYAWEFYKEYGAKDAVGSCKRRASQRQWDRQQLGNRVGRSDWIQRVRASRSTEWFRSFIAAFIIALCCGVYVMKIVSS